MLQLRFVLFTICKSVVLESALLRVHLMDGIVRCEEREKHMQLHENIIELRFEVDTERRRS